MKSNRSKNLFYLFLLLLIGYGFYYITSHLEFADNPDSVNKITRAEAPKVSLASNDDIAELTAQKTVVNYVKSHRKLPDYYITKRKARANGWIASKGNLCEILPGHAIGGDVFGNREGRLPKKPGRKYFEADLNYDCGRRGADRLIYSNDGLIFVTKNHYKSFQKQ